jgi:hypothetical protein
MTIQSIPSIIYDFGYRTDPVITTLFNTFNLPYRDKVNLAFGHGVTSYESLALLHRDMARSYGLFINGSYQNLDPSVVKGITGNTKAILSQFMDYVDYRLRHFPDNVPRILSKLNLLDFKIYRLICSELKYMYDVLRVPVHVQHSLLTIHRVSQYPHLKILRRQLFTHQIPKICKCYQDLLWSVIKWNETNYPGRPFRFDLMDWIRIMRVPFGHRYLSRIND